MKLKKMMIPAAAAAAVVLLAGSAFAANRLTQKAPTEPIVQEQVLVTNAPVKNNAPSIDATAIASANTISAAKAKEIALQHAELKESDVTFVRAQLDWDDGRQEYEVEFYNGNVEYDYDIDAETGKILSYDRDAEFYSPNPAETQTTQASVETIGEAKAKSIALSHAKFKEDEVSRLMAKYDWDDGRAEYDVEFNVGQIEYSYEIDAVGGKILSYEAEQDD